MWAMKLKFNLFVKVFHSNNYILRRHFWPIKTIPADLNRRRFICSSRYRFVYISPLKSPPASEKKGKNYYMEHENLLAHEVMENDSSYANSVVVHPLKTIKDDNPNLEVPVGGVFEKFYLATLHNLKEQRTLADAEFTNMANSVARDISGCNFNEIELVLYCLCLWPQCVTSYTPNFKLLWNTLDSECTHQLRQWTANEKLLVSDYWFHLRLSRISIYNTSMIKDLISTGDKLTDSQFVQLMFCVTVQRIFPQPLLNALEKRLEIAVSTVSMEELSLICLGFFKTENKVNNQNILRTILKRTTSDVNNLGSQTIVRLLKFLRKSFHPHLIQCYVSLLKECAANLGRWDLLTAVHASALCTAGSIFEPSLLDAVVEKAKNDIPNSRLKDIRKIVQCLAQFNYMPHSEFHEVLFQEIMGADRLEEARRFPNDLLQLFLFYAYMGQYPLNVMRYILSSDFVQYCQETCGDHILKNFITLDYCVEVECSDYTGPRLKPHLLKHRRKNVGSLTTDSDGRDYGIVRQFIKLTEQAVSELMTPDNFIVRHVLPHMSNPVIVVRLSSKNSVPLKQLVDAYPLEKILHPPSDESWGCIIICGPFSFPFKSRQLCGLISMQVRQLKKLGYKVALIPFKDFPSYEKHRTSYVKRKLDSLRTDAEQSTLDTNHHKDRKASL